MDIKAAIDYPRFSIKFNSTAEVFYEYGFPFYLIKDLERKGQQTQRMPLEKFLGNVNAVCMTKQTEEILANADHRKSGGSAGF
jgi:gamma-glutamyltranspeptidase